MEMIRRELQLGIHVGWRRPRGEDGYYVAAGERDSYSDTARFYNIVLQSYNFSAKSGATTSVRNQFLHSRPGMNETSHAIRE